MKICPTCGHVCDSARTAITDTAIEAFRLVYMQGLTQSSAAALMGCNQSNVSRYLDGICDLLDLRLTPDTPPRMFSLDISRDYRIRQKW